MSNAALKEVVIDMIKSAIVDAEQTTLEYHVTGKLSDTTRKETIDYYTELDYSTLDADSINDTLYEAYTNEVMYFADDCFIKRIINSASNIGILSLIPQDKEVYAFEVGPRMVDTAFKFLKGKEDVNRPFLITTVLSLTVMMCEEEFVRLNPKSCTSGIQGKLIRGDNEIKCFSPLGATQNNGPVSDSYFIIGYFNSDNEMIVQKNKLVEFEASNYDLT